MDPERARVHRQLTLIVVGLFAAAPPLWAVGAPRFALACFLLGVTGAVMRWGPREQRISPSKGEPIPVATSFVWFSQVVGFAAVTVVLLPHPPLAIAAGFCLVAMLALWIITRRWPRGYPSNG